MVRADEVTFRFLAASRGAARAARPDAPHPASISPLPRNAIRRGEGQWACEEHSDRLRRVRSSADALR